MVHMLNVLGWPKSSFEVFTTMACGNLNELFGQANTYRSPVGLVTYTSLALRGSNSGSQRWTQRSASKRTHPGNTKVTLEILHTHSSGTSGPDAFCNGIKRLYAANSMK